MKRIVVGLDASPRAREVLDTAAGLAQAYGAKLLLVRAVALPTELPPQALSMTPDDLATLLVDDARHELERLAATLPEAIRGGVRAQIGAPWQIVCEAGKAENADLIVIGSHGYGTLDRLLGTTAAKVVNHADRSVLVVRAGSRVTA
jgi:nucleotide-binding universal stress UspA family protein